MKKRILSVLLAAAFAASSLAGCSSSSGDTTEDTGSTDAEAEEDSDTGEEDSDSSEEDTQEDTSEISAEYEISSVLTDLETLTDANGDEITLTSTDDYVIAGNYICYADNSAWAFYDSVLAVGYEDEDGTPVSSVCEVGFYIGSEDADGDQHIVLAIHNLLADTTTLWYVYNMIDEDENVLGIELVTPGADDIYIVLYTADSDDEDSDDEDSEDTSSEDEDSEDTDSDSEE